LKEREGKAILTRRFEDRNITLTWDPSIEVAAHDHLDPDALGEDQEDESADQQADGNNEGDANDEEGEYDEGAADEKVAGDLEIEVRVEAQNKTLVAHCAVAEDCLLYVYQLTLPSSDRYVTLLPLSLSPRYLALTYSKPFVCVARFDATQLETTIECCCSSSAQSINRSTT